MPNTRTNDSAVSTCGPVKIQAKIAVCKDTRVRQKRSEEPQTGKKSGKDIGWAVYVGQGALKSVCWMTVLFVCVCVFMCIYVISMIIFVCMCDLLKSISIYRMCVPAPEEVRKGVRSSGIRVTADGKPLHKG